MAKTKEQKKDLLKQYQETLSNSDGYIVINPQSLSTPIITNLKKQLEETGCSYTVVKNTVFKIALQETDAPLPTLDFKGATAVIAYSDDPTVVAKLIEEVQKETNLLPTKYGFVGNKFLGSENVMRLAKIPSKEVLLAKLLGSLNAPTKGFMHCTVGTLESFTRVLSSISQKKE